MNAILSIFEEGTEIVIYSKTDLESIKVQDECKTANFN